MRRTRIPMLALAALVAAPAVVSAQGSFEGTVTYQIRGEGSSPTTMLYSVKGGEARVDVSYGGKESVMLFDAVGHMTMMMPQQKMYMTFPDLGGNKELEKKHYTITRTGHTEMIAGHSCDDWQVQDQQDKEITTMCVARGMGDIVFARNRLERNRNAMATLLADPQFREVTKGGFFPLKISTTRDKDLWVATKIEPRTLDGSLFEVPPGYRPFSMPNMQPPGH